MGRSLTSADILETLTERFTRYGLPVYIRSDMGPELAEAKGFIKQSRREYNYGGCDPQRYGETAVEPSEGAAQSLTTIPDREANGTG